MVPSSTVSRTAGLLAALMVVTMTFLIARRAYAVVNTPNAALDGYSLANGGFDNIISLPMNQAILVMGTCTTLGDRGVGHVSALSVPTVGGVNGFVEWVGLHSPAVASITSGFSNTTGQKIVNLSFGGGVDIEVANLNDIRVHNTSGGARAGNVTLMW